MPERRGRKHDVLEPPRATACFYLGFQQSLKKTILFLFFWVFLPFILPAGTLSRQVSTIIVSGSSGTMLLPHHLVRIHDYQHNAEPV
jgi:hypothetical protein